MPVFLKQFKYSDVQLLTLDPDGDVRWLEHVGLTIQFFLGLQVRMEFLIFMYGTIRSPMATWKKIQFKCVLFDLCNMLFVMCVSSDAFPQIEFDCLVFFSHFN